MSTVVRLPDQRRGVRMTDHEARRLLTSRGFVFKEVTRRIKHRVTPAETFVQEWNRPARGCWDDSATAIVRTTFPR